MIRVGVATHNHGDDGDNGAKLDVDVPATDLFSTDDIRIDEPIGGDATVAAVAVAVAAADDDDDDVVAAAGAMM